MADCTPMTPRVAPTFTAPSSVFDPSPAPEGPGEGFTGGPGWVAALRHGNCLAMTVIRAVGRCNTIDTSQEFLLTWSDADQAWVSDIDFDYVADSGPVMFWVEEGYPRLTINGEYLVWNSAGVLAPDFTVRYIDFVGGNVLCDPPGGGSGGEEDPVDCEPNEFAVRLVCAPCHDPADCEICDFTGDDRLDKKLCFQISYPMAEHTLDFPGVFSGIFAQMDEFTILKYGTSNLWKETITGMSPEASAWEARLTCTDVFSFIHSGVTNPDVVLLDQSCEVGGFFRRYFLYLPNRFYLNGGGSEDGTDHFYPNSTAIVTITDGPGCGSANPPPAPAFAGCIRSMNLAICGTFSSVVGLTGMPANTTFTSPAVDGNRAYYWSSGAISGTGGASFYLVNCYDGGYWVYGPGVTGFTVVAVTCDPTWSVTVDVTVEDFGTAGTGSFRVTFLEGTC